MLGLRASRAQYKRMGWNLPLKKSICLTQAFRSHFLLKEDRKKLKVEKEGSDVYEQNEPQIEKADQGEIPLSIGVLRWERNLALKRANSNRAKCMASTPNSTFKGLRFGLWNLSYYEIASHLAVLTPLAYRSSVQKPRPRTCIEKDFPRRSSSSIPT
ncbi:hypothetical protein QVD17_12093 [Tagetes erecta]|uniref:Uncharacterized protein n=1 Tax=Tagetes erecta TaxID=13708 RepID=A0AAD8KZ56_TARER|nr:hypothetical protein QVD17_12093 [Tagetes erecta]